MEEEAIINNDDDYLNRLPPGYKFMPEEHELIHYLQLKVAGGYIVSNLFHDVDVYNHPPQQLHERYRRKGENATYYFSPRNKKYPKGKRPDRAVRIQPNESVQGGKVGFWRVNSKYRNVSFNDTVIGTRRNLKYFTGKPKINEKKTKWLMQEFMLDNAQRKNNATSTHENKMQLDDWVLYKIYQNRSTKPDRRKSRQEDTEQQEVQNSNVPQPQSEQQLQPSSEPQLQSMNQISQLATYPSLMPLNNINAENPLMPLPPAYPSPMPTINISPQNPFMTVPLATVYSDDMIGLMHDPYAGLMSTTLNLPNYNVAQYSWEPPQLQDGFMQSPLMPPMQPQDESMQPSSESSGFTCASTFGRHGGV